MLLAATQRPMLRLTGAWSRQMHLNVRSANNKAVRINEYVEEKDPDFLAMTETWIRFGNATINAMCPAGYRFIGKPRKERGGA